MVEPEVDGGGSTAVVDTPERDQMGAVLPRIRALLPEFTGALNRVAEQVLAEPAACLSSSP